jgi:hypothetical protein
MKVADLISILQTKDPLSVVVLRDLDSDTGFVEARDIDTLTLRAYSRKGTCFLGLWDDERPPQEKTDVGAHTVLGVLIE